MLIMLLLDVFFGVLHMLFSIVQLPPVPDQLLTYMYDFFGILQSAMGFVWLVVSQDLVLVLLPIVVVVSQFKNIYNLLMWVVKKIPMLGVQ